MCKETLCSNKTLNQIQTQSDDDNEDEEKNILEEKKTYNIKHE